MKSRTKFLLTCMIGALIIGAGPMMSPSHAADTMPVKAMPVAAPVPYWWYSGDVEVGGRFFLNNPTKDGIASQGQKSLGKYYEYSSIKPGPFSNVWLGTGTSDGLYKFDLWADNIGYSDQRYEVSGSKAGQVYVDGIYDQTPHVYSTNALTLYQGLGTGALTLPPGLSNILFGNAGCVRVANQPPTGCTSASLGTTNAVNPTVVPSAAGLAVQNTINNNVYTTEIGIRRDTAGGTIRWLDELGRRGLRVLAVAEAPATTDVGAR